MKTTDDDEVGATPTLHSCNFQSSLHFYCTMTQNTYGRGKPFCSDILGHLGEYPLPCEVWVLTFVIRNGKIQSSDSNVFILWHEQFKYLSSYKAAYITSHAKNGLLCNNEFLGGHMKNLY